MLSRFDEARAKPTFNASPSITSAVLPKPSLPSFSRSSRVLPSLRSRLSTTTSWPLIALDDSAILRPTARTFVLRLVEKIRARGPWALPPPTKIGARRSPWRAVPPPFWRPNFLPVRLTSLRSRAARAGARRLVSCQVTTRWRMSARGSTPKIESSRVMSPPDFASRLWTLTFILAVLAFVGRLLVGSRGFALGRLAGLAGLGFGLDLAVERTAGFLLGGDRRDLVVARKRRDFVDRGVVDQAGSRSLGFDRLVLAD